MRKTENGHDYPQEAYAYVPSRKEPDTWRFRLCEGNEPSIEQLGIAANELREAETGGEALEHLDKAKARIRQAYDGLGIESACTPSWIRESHADESSLGEFTPLEEKSAINDKGLAEVVVIRPGFNKSKRRYYPAETLARDHQVFEGAQMFLDHPTVRQRRERPERSMRDLVGVLENVHVGSGGEVRGTARVFDPPFRERLASMSESGMLSRIGVSINGLGKTARATVEGVSTLRVDKIAESESVDFVTAPGAGGAIELYESDDGSDPAAGELDSLSLETLRTVRPDLVEAIREGGHNTMDQETKDRLSKLEADNKQLQETNESLTEECDETKSKLEEAQKTASTNELKAKIDATMAEAPFDKMDESESALFRKQFGTAESEESLTAMVESEREKLAELAKSGKVRGLGRVTESVSTDGSDAEEDKNKLREHYVSKYQREGKSKEEAERLAESIVNR